VRSLRTTLVAACVVTSAAFAVAPAAGSGAGSASAKRAAAADSMVERINAVRARHGLQPLRPSGSLDSSSRRFAGDLMRQNVLAHRARPSTSYPNAGEVLALHMGANDRVEWTVRRWMRSPSHRAVLLIRSMREIGAGVAHGRFNGRRAVIWVAQVGKR